MENDRGLTIRIVVRLPDLDVGGRWYESEGRAQLVIILKRLTHQLAQAIKYDYDMHGVKFRVRLHQWIEGAEQAKLPKMRDIFDSDRDWIDG